MRRDIGLITIFLAAGIAWAAGGPIGFAATGAALVGLALVLREGT